MFSVEFGHPYFEGVLKSYFYFFIIFVFLHVLNVIVQCLVALLWCWNPPKVRMRSRCCFTSCLAFDEEQVPLAEREGKALQPGEEVSGTERENVTTSEEREPLSYGDSDENIAELKTDEDVRSSDEDEIISDRMRGSSLNEGHIKMEGDLDVSETETNPENQEEKEEEIRSKMKCLMPRDIARCSYKTYSHKIDCNFRFYSLLSQRIYMRYACHRMVIYNINNNNYSSTFINCNINELRSR